MIEVWNDIVKDLVVEQGLECAYCPATRSGKRPNRSTQGAHALIHKRDYNNRKKHKKINVRENFLPCCDDCQKFSETYKGRCWAWKVLCAWYGESRIKAWYDGLNLKVRESYD